MLDRTISHYQLVEKIGEGGMGVVYKARDARLNRLVAIKILPADKVADPSRKERFIQEARAASALNHPNVITIYDIDADEGVDFIAMEYVAGRSLDQMIPRQGLRLSEVLRYGVQIADALAAAHAAGIVHRDLKPANILVSDAGLVKVLDFGIAKLTEQKPAAERSTRHVSVPATDEGKILGTAAYMSPEQAQGLKVDGRSDIFSLGAVLYEMLTGEPAFSGETTMSTIAAVLNRDPRELPEPIPRELARVVTRALKKDPARRFQTMADLKVALEELREESDSGRLIAPERAAPLRSPRWPLAAAAVIALTAAALGAFWLRGSTPAAAPAVDQRDLRQLTFDAADSSFPSLSPDAKLIAYQSDRDHPGRYDIWVQQTSGGSAVRLTTDNGDHRIPTFSGDGTRVYFSSTTPHPGVYEVSALGGEPRLIVANAVLPRVSPDGKYLVYFTPETGRLFVAPTAGGDAHPVADDFSLINARAVWFYDSKRLALFAQKKGDPQTREWWSFAIDGSESRRLNWVRWAGQHQHFGTPDALLRSGGIATLALRLGENQQLYFTKRLENDDAIGDPRALTVGAAWSANASVAQGKMAFQSGIPETGLWTLPADTGQARVTGTLSRVNADRAVISHVSTTPDGRIAVFSSNRTGSQNVTVRDLASGNEHVITAGSPDRASNFAVVDAAGTKVVYSVSRLDDVTSFDVYEVPLQGGPQRKICDRCGPTLSLSPDGAYALTVRQDAVRTGIDLLDVANGTTTSILQHSTSPMNAARFSPDGKSIAAVAVAGPTSGDVIIAPFRGQTAVPESEWIRIARNTAGATRQAFWSPDGGILYFDLTTLGATALMGQRLDRAHHPVGPPFRVYEFSGRIRPPDSRGPLADSLSAVPGAFIGALQELNFNIWMMNLPRDIEDRRVPTATR